MDKIQFDLPLHQIIWYDKQDSIRPFTKSEKRKINQNPKMPKNISIILNHSIKEKKL